MKKFLSLILALVMLLSFSVVALAGNGDGTGGGDGSGGGTGELEFTVTNASNEFSIDNVVIYFNVKATGDAGGMKHIEEDDYFSNMINSSTMVLTDSSGPVSGFTVNAVPKNIGERASADFTVTIDGSILKENTTYYLTIKAGATWSRNSNVATLASDYTYEFKIAGESEDGNDDIVIETTTVASKQKSPLVTKASTDKVADEETTLEEGETTIETAGETTTYWEEVAENSNDVVVDSEMNLVVASNDVGSSEPLEITMGASAVVLAVLCVVRKKMVF